MEQYIPNEEEVLLAKTEMIIALTKAMGENDYSAFAGDWEPTAYIREHYMEYLQMPIADFCHKFIQQRGADICKAVR